MSAQQPVIREAQARQRAALIDARRYSKTRFADLMELTKPRITFLVLVTTAVGFYMGSSDSVNFLLMFHAVVGTALIASGASALNQYVERHLDARMVRTRNRPLPDGRLQTNEALAFSVAISAGGVAYLLYFVNALTALLGFATLAGYI